MKLPTRHLLLFLDLAGTFVFGAEGAAMAVRFHLDVLGVLVIAFVTALGGGLIRDVLLGAVPPSSIRDWRYPAAALVAGGLYFALHLSPTSFNEGLITTLDAAGLSLFAVAGALKAMELKLHPLPAIMLGGVTGVGGGTVRDVFLNQVPHVFQSDVYATAALAGAALAVLLLRVGVPQTAASAAGVVFCFVLRMASVVFHWNLPRH